mgnify:CR=1 FL=1
MQAISTSAGGDQGADQGTNRQSYQMQRRGGQEMRQGPPTDHQIPQGSPRLRCKGF